LNTVTLLDDGPVVYPVSYVNAIAGGLTYLLIHA